MMTMQKSVSQSRKRKDKAHLSIFEGGLSQHLSSGFNRVHKPAEIQPSYPIVGEEEGIMFVKNLLSPAECANLILATNEIGYIPTAGFDKKVRSNSRCRTIDAGMSTKMLERLAPVFPPYLVIDGCRWKIKGFLDNWRYCKYREGEHFSPHYDGSKKFTDYSMSVFTVNIYLNDGFEGGGTRFYMNCEKDARENDWAAAGSVTHTIQPKQGSALIFNHCDKGYLHDGEPFRPTETVQAKYIMRADLVYKVDDADLSRLQAKEENGECRFWSLAMAEAETVINYVGRTWQCACVSHNVTVTLH